MNPRIKMVGWVLTTMAITMVARAAFARDTLATVEDARAFDRRDVTVLVFLFTDCPIANSMAPELGRIREDYAKKGVSLYRVYADKTLDSRAVLEHGKEYSLEFPAVLDESLELVRLTGATITPEAVVYNRNGERLYRGRINNRYEELGKYRQEATVHDLRNALDAILAGKEVANPETEAVGCYLPTPPEAVEEKQEPVHEETPIQPE